MRHEGNRHIRKILVHVGQTQRLKSFIDILIFAEIMKGTGKELLEADVISPCLWDDISGQLTLLVYPLLYVGADTYPRILPLSCRVELRG